jgi:hypothetical protein
MAITDKVAAFLSKVKANAGTIAGTSGTAAGEALGQIGTATGALLSGMPAPTTYYGKTNVVASEGGINPGGLLGAVGMKGAAANLQAAYQDPRVAQMIGAGVVGAGALGAAGAGVMAHRAVKGHKARMAGQNLGAQLGVGMPSVA